MFTLGVASSLLALLQHSTCAPPLSPLTDARSVGGEYVLRVEPGGRQGDGTRQCVGTLFHCAAGAEGERQLWRRPLVNDVAPEIARVAEDGQFVVTLDEYQRGGARNAVVIYDGRGRMLRRFRLQQLLTREDWRHVAHDKAARAVRWLTGARCEFITAETGNQAPSAGGGATSDGRALFAIRLAWGRHLYIDLRTLKLARADGSSEAPPPAPQFQPAVSPAEAAEINAELARDLDATPYDAAPGVEVSVLQLPIDAQVEGVSHLHDGSMAILGKRREGPCWTQVLRMVRPSGEASDLFSATFDAVRATGVSYGPLMLSATGSCALTWRYLGNGIRETVMRGKPVPIANPPTIEPILWDFATGAQRLCPAGVMPRGWVDEQRLLVTVDSSDGLGPVLYPREFRLLDARTLSMSAPWSAGGPIRDVLRVAPGFVAYSLGPDRRNPKPDDELYLAAQLADRLRRVNPHVSWIAQAALRDASREAATDAPDNRAGAATAIPASPTRWLSDPPVVPFPHPDDAFGPLCLLDLRDPAQPRMHELMSVFPCGTTGAVSPDGRFVAFNQELGAARVQQAQFILYDTVTRTWTPLGTRVASARWHPDGKRITAFTLGEEPVVIDINLEGILRELPRTAGIGP